MATMKPGSVIVDMAAAQGGNVAGSVAGEKVVTDNGVTILGYTDLAGRLPDPGLAAVRHQPGQPDEAAHAGQGRPARPRLRRRRPAQRHRRPRRREDVAAAARRGVRGTPAAAPAAVPVAARAKKAPTSPAVKLGPDRGRHPRAVPGQRLRARAAARALHRAHARVVIGYYVIGKVHHALHTPLMSVTNAISGIIVVGAMLQISSATVRTTRRRSACCRSSRSCSPPSTSSADSP